MNLTVREILKCTRGTLIQGSEELSVSGISTDTRTLDKGNLFVALQGENFDGHNFIENAVERGAVSVLGVSSKLEKYKDRLSVALIGVDDSLHALGDIANFWRTRHEVRVIAITGSNGKTSTKEMIAALVGRKYRTLRNVMNLNNLVGVPLTLFNLRREHKIAVIEMGMNRPGEIARLAEIAEPDYGLITNVQPAHLEGLRSLKGIQKAKGELFSGVKENGVLFVNLDDPLIVELAEKTEKHKVTFGESPEADVFLTGIISQDVEGSRFRVRFENKETELFLPVLGKHQIKNALAAAAVAWKVGVPLEEIKEGLATHRPVKQRMEVKKLRKDIFILDDSYNANPSSVSAALETVAEIGKKGRFFAVLGAMLELGPESPRYHRLIGEKVARLGYRGLLSLGELGREIIKGARGAGMPVEYLYLGQNHADVATRLLEWLQPGDWVLVKGSRGSRMELVIEKLIENKR